MTCLLQATVVIPTYRRPHYLAKVMQGVAALEADPATFEVLVVDNNSEDDTPDVCDAFAQSHPRINFQFVCETRQGLSHARNRGVEEARGEFICMLDDDAAPTTKWLGLIVEGFSDPAVGAVGGPLIPDYLGQERPPWLHGDLQGLVGGHTFPFNKPTMLMTRYGSPSGGNMAFRRRVFDSVGLFRSDLDPSGSVRLLGGETELFKRIELAGWRILYIPDAVVNHFVPPHKLNKSYLYEEGRRRAATHIIMTMDGHPRKITRWFASDLWFTLRLFSKFLVARLVRRGQWFDDYMRYWIVAQRLPIRLNALLHGDYTRAAVLAQVPETRP